MSVFLCLYVCVYVGLLDNVVWLILVKAYSEKSKRESCRFSCFNCVRTNHLIVGEVPKRSAICTKTCVISGVRVATIVAEPNIVA